MALNSDNPKQISSSESLLAQLGSASQMNQGYETSEYLQRYIQNLLQRRRIPAGEVVTTFVGNIITPYGGAPYSLSNSVYWVQRQTLVPAIARGAVSTQPQAYSKITLANDTSADFGYFVAATNLAETNATNTGTTSLPQDGSVFVEVTGVRCQDGSGLVLYYFNQPVNTPTFGCPSCGGTYAFNTFTFSATSLTAITAALAAAGDLDLGPTGAAFTNISWAEAMDAVSVDSGFYNPGGAFPAWTELSSKSFYVEMGFSSALSSPCCCVVFLRILGHDSSYSGDSAPYHMKVLYFGYAAFNCSGTFVFNSAQYPGPIPGNYNGTLPPASDASPAGTFPPYYNTDCPTGGFIVTGVSSGLATGKLTLSN